MKCARSVGDTSFGVEVDVADASVEEATKLGWAEVNKHLAAASKSPEKPNYKPAEFIDKGTGEAFDVADDSRFKTALTMLLKRREFGGAGSTTLSQYLLNNAKVQGFGAMKPPARLAVLEDIARGKYDSFKKGPQA